jgi:hypothetical protein
LRVAIGPASTAAGGAERNAVDPLVLAAVKYWHRLHSRVTRLNTHPTTSGCSRFLLFHCGFYPANSSLYCEGFGSWTTTTKGKAGVYRTADLVRQTLEGERTTCAPLRTDEKKKKKKTWFLGAFCVADCGSYINNPLHVTTPAPLSISINQPIPSPHHQKVKNFPSNPCSRGSMVAKPN